MASKKKQDEKHLKILREMVALPHNKQCLDCHQRGPTYINMTIGSYVCTACSGLLRGLNPPHRVKSISMASFTSDEIEFIKCHGNEYCRKVWLGLYDNRVSLQAEGRDESKVKDFMTQKYERKRYYVAPTDSMKEEAKSMNESAITTKVPGTKPLKSLLGENAPRIQVGNYQKAAATPPPINSNPQSPGSTSIQSSKSSGSTAMDLLGDLGGDPFASSTPQSQSSSGGGFADFGNFGNTATSSQPPAFTPNAPLQPAGSGSQQLFNGFGSTPASTAPAAPQVGGGDKYSNLSDLFSVTTAEETSTATGWTTSLNSGGGGGMNWGGAQTSNSTSAGGLNWGGDGNSAGSGGLNWNSSSTQSAPSSTGMGWGGANSTSTSWGGAPATAQSNVSNPFGGNSGTNLTSQSGLGMPTQQPSANPFGGQAVSSSGFGAFGAQTAPAPQNAGFGQFGGPPTVSSGGGFGQFGTPASTASAGFGQFGVQNGGFGANTPTTGFGGAQPTMSTGFGAQQGFATGQPGAQQGFATGQPGFGQQQQAGFGGAGFGAQPTQGFPQQQQPAGFGGQQAQMQGFGGAPGWGQMPAGSANPFMSTAQQYSNTAPKAGATNPFL